MVINLKTILKLLLITSLAIISLFMSCIIPIASFYMPLGYPLIILTAVLLLVANYKILISILATKHNKIFLLYWLWVFICVPILSCFGIYKEPLHFLTSFFLGNIVFVILPFCFGNILIKFFDIRFSIKFIYILFALMIGFAIFEFIAFQSSNKFLISLYNMLVNKRSITSAKDISLTVYYVNNLIRLKSTFDEPANLGYFINLFYPFILKLSDLKIIIFKNNIFNKIFRFIIPILTAIILILVQSPIHLVIFIIINIVYFTVENKLKLKYILYSALFLLLISSLSVYYLQNIEIEETFLNRIKMTLFSLGSYKLLIDVEPSFATRICSYVNQFILFLKNFFLGIGWVNTKYVIFEQYARSPLPLTPEMIFKPEYKFNITVFLKIAEETGIVGVGIFYYFLYTIYKDLGKIKKYLKGELLNFAQGGQYFIISYICLSFYDSYFEIPLIWLIFGILIGFIQKIYTTKRSIDENTIHS